MLLPQYEYQPHTCLKSRLVGNKMCFPIRLHPRDKQDVAFRLTLGARALAYNETDVLFQGPFPSQIHFMPAYINITYDQMLSFTPSADTFQVSHIASVTKKKIITGSIFIFLTSWKLLKYCLLHFVLASLLDLIWCAMTNFSFLEDLLFWESGSMWARFKLGRRTNCARISRRCPALYKHVVFSRWRSSCPPVCVEGLALQL